MNASQLSMSINALANLVACKLDDQELAIVASLVNQFADDLKRISIDRVLINDWCKSNCKCNGKGNKRSEGNEELEEEIEELIEEA